MVYRLRILLEKIWSYAAELIAAALICVFIWILLGGEQIAVWQIDKKVELLAFMGVTASISGAIFAAYFAVLSTELGQMLRTKGIAVEYVSAFAFPLLLFLATAAMLTFISKDSGKAFSWIITYLLCYSCINCVTTIKNVLGIVRLWQDVEVSKQQR